MHLLFQKQLREHSILPLLSYQLKVEHIHMKELMLQTQDLVCMKLPTTGPLPHVSMRLQMPQTLDLMSMRSLILGSLHHRSMKTLTQMVTRVIHISKTMKMLSPKQVSFWHFQFYIKWLTRLKKRDKVYRFSIYYHIWQPLKQIVLQ